MSNVLVDSSVWIEFFRRRDSEPVSKLTELKDSKLICITSLVVAEILSGMRNESEYERIRMYLNAFPYISEPADCWEQVGRTRFMLARKGLKISIPDTLITVIAISNHKTLFTLDKIFKTIAKYLPLKIFS